jgi:hypothetical protein
VFSAAGLNSVLTDIRNRFGDTMGYQLMLGPNDNDAAIFRADPNNARHQTLYAYVNNSWSAQDSASPVPPAGEAIADLSKFDVTAVTATLKAAPQSLGMTNIKTTTLLTVDGVADASLNLSANISGSGGYEGTIDINQDGSVKALHPPS